MNWTDKVKENLTSIKFWCWGAATSLLIFGIISETSWVGLTAGLMGVARVFEYFANKKNGTPK